MKDARQSAYDSTTHCTPAREALKSFCRMGSATFTIVPSMKIMLEPRIVAARIHGRAAFAAGATHGPASTSAASQGCLCGTATECRQGCRGHERAPALGGSP